MRLPQVQTCSPDDVPRNRQELREYYARMRPELLASPLAEKAMRHLLTAEVMLPPMPKVLGPGSWVVTRILRAATIATLPQWIREAAGSHQPRIVDALVRPVMRIAFAVGNRSKRFKVEALSFLSPMTRDVAAPVIYGIPPTESIVRTPAEARELYGYDPPAEAHLELRERQRARVFGEGLPPSDEGIRASEAVLGPTGT